MKRTRKHLLECLRALRSEMQINYLLRTINRSLTREIRNDAICGAWTQDDGVLVSLHKTRTGEYRGVLYQNGRYVCHMIVQEQNGQLQLRELRKPGQSPVVYFISSELLLLGHRGIFRRLGNTVRSVR